MALRQMSLKLPNYFHCPSCGSPFDSNDRRPKHLPCGCTVCILCVQVSFTNGLFQCTACCAEMSHDQNPEQLPDNLNILQVIRPNTIPLHQTKSSPILYSSSPKRTSPSSASSPSLQSPDYQFIDWHQIDKNFQNIMEKRKDVNAFLQRIRIFLKSLDGLLSKCEQENHVRILEIQCLNQEKNTGHLQAATRDIAQNLEQESLKESNHLNEVVRELRQFQYWKIGSEGMTSNLQAFQHIYSPYLKINPNQDGLMDFLVSFNEDTRQPITPVQLPNYNNYLEKLKEFRDREKQMRHLTDRYPVDIRREFMFTSRLCYDSHLIECGFISQCCWNPKMERLACCLADGTVRIFQPETASDWFSRWEKITHRPNIPGILYCIDWSSSGTQLATGSEWGDVWIWKQDDESPSYLKGHSKPVIRVKWNKKGAARYLLTAAGDSRVIVWEGIKGVPIQQFEFHKDWIRDIEWLSSNTFASCSRDNTIQICQIGQKTPLRTLLHDKPVLGIHSFYDGKWLASCGEDHAIKVWSVDCGSVVTSFRTSDDVITSVNLSNENRHLLACASSNGCIRIWDITERKYIQVLWGHEHGVNAVAFSPDNQLLASCDSQGEIRIWSTKTWRCLDVKNTSSSLSHLTWNSYGNRLAICNGDRLSKLKQNNLNIHVMEITEYYSETSSLVRRSPMLISTTNPTVVDQQPHCAAGGLSLPFQPQTRVFFMLVNTCLRLFFILEIRLLLSLTLLSSKQMTT